MVIDGRVVKNGGEELADRINREGYEWIRREMTEEVTDEKK